MHQCNVLTLNLKALTDWTLIHNYTVLFFSNSNVMPQRILYLILCNLILCILYLSLYWIHSHIVHLKALNRFLMLAFTCMFAKIYINRTPVGYTIHKGSLNTLTIKTAIGTIDSNILLYSINFLFMRIINQIFYCRCKDQAGWLFQNQTIANQQSGKYNLNLMYFKTHLLPQQRNPGQITWSSILFSGLIWT